MPVVEASSDTVLLESVGTVRVVTLNRPEKLNAVDLAMQQRLLARLETVAADKEARALILTGAGRAFCAGGDRDVLREIVSGQSTQQADLGRVYGGIMRCMLNISIPVIAAVNGLAVGFAAGVVAMCDIVVLGEDAFLCDPHVRFGIAADPMVQLMWPKLASAIVAREVLMSGRQVEAKEAVALGLANRTCPKGQERAVALEMANVFAALPEAGVAATKHTFNRSLRDEAERIFQTVDG